MQNKTDALAVCHCLQTRGWRMAARPLSLPYNTLAWTLSTVDYCLDNGLESSVSPAQLRVRRGTFATPSPIWCLFCLFLRYRCSVLVSSCCGRVGSCRRGVDGRLGLKPTVLPTPFDEPVTGRWRTTMFRQREACQEQKNIVKTVLRRGATDISRGDGKSGQRGEKNEVLCCWL